MFFYYVDLEYEVILSSDIFGPNRPNYHFSRSFIEVRCKLSLFFHYVNLEYMVILSSDIVCPIGLIRPNYLFSRSFTHVRGKLSLFFHYVDLECENITHWDLLGPIGRMTSFMAHSPMYELSYRCSFTTST